MSVAYGYCRVSDESQVQTGLSLDAQRQACREEYERLKKEHPDLRWGDCFVDPAVSGTMPFRDRAAGRALQDRLQEGDFLITSKVDRAFRTAEDCIVTVNIWRRTGIRIQFLDCPGDQDDPGWMLLVIMKGGFAQYEVDTTKKRMMAAIEQKRQRGECISRRPPIGHKFVVRNVKGRFRKVIELDQDALTSANYIIDMRKAGWSWNKIAHMLNEAGRKTTLGGRWNQDIVPRYHKWGISQGLKGDPTWRNTMSASISSLLGWKPPRQRDTTAEQSTSSGCPSTCPPPKETASLPASS